MAYTIRPLDASTWDEFAELVERTNGIFGGCWCIGYHLLTRLRERTAESSEVPVHATEDRDQQPIGTDATIATAHVAALL